MNLAITVLNDNQGLVHVSDRFAVDLMEVFGDRELLVVINELLRRGGHIKVDVVNPVGPHCAVVSDDAGAHNG